MKDCPYCSRRASDPPVAFGDDLVWFLQDSRFQGALKHSGVIIPIKHRETVFDLSDGEIAATFQLLSRVKAWMDREFLPDGYNIGLELRAGRWAGAVPCPFARYSKVPTGAARGEGNQVSPQVGCKPMVDGSS